MWQKFGAGIWEALAKKYPEIDMNDYAPARNYSEPAPKPSAVVQPPAAGSSKKATTADMSASSFDAVPADVHITAIRRLYTVVNPDKMAQVDSQTVGLVAWNEEQHVMHAALSLVDFRLS